MRSVAALLVLFAIALVGVTANRKPVVTMVAGLWDMKRGELNNQYKRTFEYYLSYLEQGLQTDTNLIIFGEERLEKFIKEKRKNPNTVFVHKTLQSFHKNWQTSKMIKTLHGLKSRANWNQVNTLPYFSLEMYNPVVMSKFFLMVQAIEHDIFDSDYFMWIDAGLLHIYSTEIAQEYVSRKYLQNILQIYQGPWYFNYYEFNEPLIFVGYAKGSSPYLSHPVTQRDMLLGGLHGGRIQALQSICRVYENFLRITLENGDMTSDESIFSMMVFRFPSLMTLLNRGVFSDLMSGFTIQSFHYLTNVQHRKFIFKADGTFESEELSLKKQKKVNFTRPVSLVLPKREQTIVKEEKKEEKEVATLPQEKNASKLPELEGNQSVQYFKSIGALIDLSIPKLMNESLISHKFVFYTRIFYSILLISTYFLVFKKISEWKKQASH